MPDSWLSLSLQAAPLGWETQSRMVDQMMRLAGMNPDRRPAGDWNTTQWLSPQETKRRRRPLRSPSLRWPCQRNTSTYPKVVEQVMKNPPKHRRVKKHRRSH